MDFKKDNEENQNIFFEQVEKEEENNLINIIINNMVKFKNNIVKCKILKEQKTRDFIYITINLFNIDYSQFIITNNNRSLVNEEIKFSTKDLKLMLIKGKHYFYIQNYEIIKHKKFELKEANIFNSLKDITKDVKLFSIKLKAIEIFENYNSTRFIFQDIDNNKVNIDYPKNQEFENGKIYLFNGYRYDEAEDKMTFTMISNIQEYSNDKSELKSIQNTLCLNKPVSFKCKVKSFSLTYKHIIIEDSSQKIYKVNVNYNLLKKISINGICFFFDFIKIKENEFEMTNFSDIEFEEETFIEFIFECFDIQKNFYNKIKINKEVYDINKKIMKIKIKDKNKKNIFIQDIIYERIKNKKSTGAHKFSLEIEKGKINHFHSFLGYKGGHSYQLYIKSRFKKDMPNSISINVNNNIFVINDPDKYENNLIERFTIINIPKQDINELLQLPNRNIDNKLINKKIFDWKYLISINNRHKINYKIFFKEKFEEDKKYFKIKDSEFNIIRDIFNNNINEEIDTKTKEDIARIIKPYIDYISPKKIKEILTEYFEGFEKYKYENKKKDYEVVKYLSFISLCFCSFFITNNFITWAYFHNFKDILKSIIYLEYIDRIKVLLGFITYLNESIEKDQNSLLESRLILINLDFKKNLNIDSYTERAYDELYKIIDNMTEDCPLYQGILTLNSIIYKDIISNKSYHSGALFNVNNIKLELIKNINRFIFISFKDDIYVDDYADYMTESNTTVIYIYSIITKENINNKKYFKRISSILLILLIHENFGHKKKNINNAQILSPRDNYDQNFEEFTLSEGDSGDALEYLLIKDTFEIDTLMLYVDSENLLDFQLYIGKNFKNLRKIYNDIINDINDKNENNSLDEKEEEEEEEKEEKKEEEKKEKKEEEKVEKKEEETEEEKGVKKKFWEKKAKKDEKDLQYKEMKEEEEENDEEHKVDKKKNIKDKEIEKKGKEIKGIIVINSTVQNEEENKIKKVFKKKKKGEEIGINNNDLNKIILDINDNSFQKTNQQIPSERKRLKYREMKRIYGAISEDEKEKRKNDCNYQRYLKILNNKKVKY